MRTAFWINGWEIRHLQSDLVEHLFALTDDDAVLQCIGADGSGGVGDLLAVQRDAALLHQCTGGAVGGAQTRSNQQAQHTNGTVGQLILEAIAGSAMLSLLGAWFWVIMKWFGFIVPKAFNLAKSFWQAWTSLSLIGLYFKCVGFIVILMLPISAGFSTYMPLFSLAMAFADKELTFLPTMGLSLLSFLVVAALTLVDVCKLRGTTVLDTVKQFLSARKR